MRTGESDAGPGGLRRRPSRLLPPGIEDLGYALLNRGNVHLQRRQPDAGRRRLRARPGTSSDVPRSRGPARQGRAQPRLRPAARPATSSARIQMIDEAAAVLAPQSAVNRATVEQDRAEILTAAGRPREAIRALEQAAQRLRLAPAAHLPGRVRADPGLDAAARGPGQGAGRGPAGGAAVPWPGEPGPGAARRRRRARRRDRRPAAGRRSLLARVDSLAAGLQANGLPHDATVLAAPGRPGQRARAVTSTTPGRGWRACGSTASSPVTTRLLWREVRAELARARGRRPARARPRARRPGRPARVAVLVRQPRPAEHPGRPRPRPRRAGARARPRARRPGAGLRVVRAGAGPGRPGRPGAAAGRRAGGQRPHRAAAAAGRAAGAAHARGPAGRGAARPRAPAPVVRRGRGRGRRAGRPRRAAVGARGGRRRAGGPPRRRRPGHRAGRARPTVRPCVELGRAATRCATGSTA